METTNTPSCSWCSEDYMNSTKCNCTNDCGHDACLKWTAVKISSGGEVIVQSALNEKYPTNDGAKCKWCHTTEPCDAKQCTCEKDCKKEHCLLGPNKGTYPQANGTSSWEKYKGNGSNGKGVVVTSGGYNHQASTTSYQCSDKSHPKVLFTWNGIKFRGAKKWTLEDNIGQVGQPKRLIVNASNSSFSPKAKPGIPDVPKLVDFCTNPFEALKDPALAIQPTEIIPYYTDELTLNWSDGKAIPADLQWWLKFLKIIQTEAYAEIDVCCVGGHGRTGTFLGIILMLTHQWKKSPSVEAEQWINKHYCSKAIETKEQQDYMDWIADRMMEPKE